ncbi:MAG: hypothetical protein ACD_33C00017G0003 [uncultured bacterium]|nr:MAG: hypothetical protein ACD_33C00017G0003 [uncultured bacterium]
MIHLVLLGISLLVYNNSDVNNEVVETSVDITTVSAPVSTSNISEAAETTNIMLPPQPREVKISYMVIEDKPLEKSRDFLYLKAKPKLPVYGMVIFTSKPSNDTEYVQYVKICKQWESTLLLTSEIETVSVNETFTTYWPTLDNKYNEESICNNLHNYNYAYANSVVNKLGINKPGPMLIAVYQTSKTIKSINLNLNVLSDKDLNDTFNVWKYDLVVTKNGWNKSFNITYFKVKFKNLLDIYGQALIEFKKG